METRWRSAKKQPCEKSIAPEQYDISRLSNEEQSAMQRHGVTHCQLDGSDLTHAVGQFQPSRHGEKARNKVEEQYEARMVLKFKHTSSEEDVKRSGG